MSVHRITYTLELRWPDGTAKPLFICGRCTLCGHWIPVGEFYAGEPCSGR